MELREARGSTPFSDQAPVETVKAVGMAASGMPAPLEGTRDVALDAPYADVVVSDATIGVPLLAQSPLYQAPQPPIDQDELQDMSFAGRLQPPIGFSGGTYALNTEVDMGSPTAMPDEALPGLRDGAYRFSIRLKQLADQGIVDNLLRQGGSYLEVNQAPYMDGERPAGR
jgi:hypothetical protein